MWPKLPATFFVLALLVSSAQAQQSSTPDTASAPAAVVDPLAAIPNSSLLEAIKSYCTRMEVDRVAQEVQDAVPKSHLSPKLQKEVDKMKGIVIAQGQPPDDPDHPLSFRFGGFFQSPGSTSLQPTCYSEPSPGAFKGPDRIALIVVTEGVDMGEKIGDSPTFDKQIPPTRGDEPDPPRNFLITIRVKSTKGANLKRPHLFYYLAKRVNDEDSPVVLWGPYEVTLPQEPFEGKLGFLFTLKDTSSADWTNLLSDFDSNGFVTVAISQKPEASQATR